jgi:hypothetical protein
MTLHGKSLACFMVAAGCAAALPAQAEDFSLQVQLSHDNTEFDSGLLPDFDATALNAVYYFDPVITDGMPVPEAAFVTRKSYVNAAATHADFGDAQGDGLAANLGYHLPNTLFYGRVGLVRQEFDGAGSDTSWNGTLGIVPLTGLMLSTDLGEDGYDANVTARYAGKLANGRWFSASLSAADPDQGDTELGFQADYYLDGIAFGGGFSTGADRWNVRIDKGLPRGFGFLVRYYADDAGNGVGAMLTWRDL